MWIDWKWAGEPCEPDALPAKACQQKSDDRTSGEGVSRVANQVLKTHVTICITSMSLLLNDPRA